MKKKLIGYGLVSLGTGVVIYRILRTLNERKKKITSKKENALAGDHKKKHPFEYGEYTL